MNLELWGKMTENNKMIQLGSILHMEKGRKPRLQQAEAAEGFLPYVDIKAFEKGIIDHYASTDRSLLCENGDLLIVCDGSRSGLTGIAIHGVVGSTLSKIWADGMTTEYLRYFIQSKYLLLNTQKKGTGTPHLNTDILKKSMLVVPSLPEQERIVSRIEELFSELDKAVETLQKIKRQLAVYRQAVLKEAFEGFANYTSLKDISERVFDGPFGSHLKTADYVDCGIRVVRLENLKDGWFDKNKESFVTRDKYETIKTHTVYPSDLIMSTFISGSIKVCQLPADIPYAVNKADCIGIRLYANYVPRFIMYYLMTRQAYHDLSGQIHGATRPRVNTTQIKAISVPMCNKKLSDEIVEQIESRLSVCDNIEKTVDAALAQSDALRQSILKEAFEGRL